MDDVKQVASGAKLESIGTVKTVVGTVKAVDPSGAERILQAGDKVYANETIVTADGGLVLIEFADGTHLDLASASKIVLDADVFNPANAKSEELTAEQIQEMIARGEDPTAVTEATAAGAGAGDEGGSSFIVVDFNNTQGNVTSGVDTAGIPGPESTTFTELPPVEDAEIQIVGSLLEIGVDFEAEGIYEGGSVVYTVTLDKASSGDIAITLSNGVVLTIPAGQLTGSSDPVPVQNDDPYVDPSQEAVKIVGMTGGGANEVLSFDPTPVDFEIYDTIDTTTVSLSTSDVNENAAGVTFTATLSNPGETAVTIVTTLGNIVIAAGDTTGTLFVNTNDPDVYVDPSSLTATVTGVTGGNFEAVDFSEASATAQISDTIDTTTITLSDVTVNEGSEATISATLNNPVTGSPLVITLSNGATIAIPVGESSGTSTSFIGEDGGSYDVSVSGTTGGNYENVVGDTATVTVIEAVPDAGGAEKPVDEDDIFPDWWGGTETNWAEEFGASVGQFTTFSAYGNGAIDGNTSTEDEGEGDALGDPAGPYDGWIDESPDAIPAPTIVSGELGVDFGVDGVGDIKFNIPSQALTSGGEPVQYWVSEDGHTIVGYVNVTQGGEREKFIDEREGESYSYVKVVFAAEITDVAAGAYTFTLYGSLDHPDGDAENDLPVNLGYTVTDADSDTADGVLAITVDDDSPVIGYPGSGYEEVQGENAYVPTAFVDEDDMQGGNGDDAGGDENQWTSETGYTGPWVWLPIEFGADGPAADNPVVLGTAGITDQYGNALTSGDEPLQYVWDPKMRTLTGYIGSAESETYQEVFTLQVEYVYQFGAGLYLDLLAPLDHPGNDAESPEDNLIFNISYTATDFDGDSTPGTLAVNVDDDSPVASITSDSVDEGSNATGVLGFMAGADGATITHINGIELEFDEDGWSQELPGEHGVLRVLADGTYSFTAQPDDLLDSDGTDTFSFTVTDGDDDTSTADFSVTVNDVPQTVTIKVFAVVGYDDNDEPILADANSVAEGEAASYVAHAVDPDGNIIAGATGTVDITFTDVDATGGTDYVSTTLTGIELGEEFSTDALDDYIADNGETFEVSAGNYSDAATYENVAYGAAVTTTIVDDSNPDTPDTPDEPDAETVTIQVFAVTGYDEETDEPILAPANSVAEGEAASYVAYAVAPDGSIIQDAEGEVTITFTNGEAGAADYVNASQTVTLGDEFSTDALDDYLADNGETFEVSAGNYSDAATYENVAYGAAVTTTIVDDSNPDTPDTPDEPDAETVTIQVFAVTGYDEETDEPILAPANSVAEGEAAAYVAYAVAPDGSIIQDAEGDVTITFTNGEAGDADYVNASQTVALGDEFSTDALDDYLADNGETFTVNASEYTNASAYENVAYGAAVTTTIVDDDVAPTIGDDSISVSEEGLPGGVADDTGVSDTTDLAVRAGSVAITTNGSAPLAVELSLADLPTTLESGDESITWVYGENHAIVLGVVGTGASAQTVIEITINGGSTSVADPATATSLAYQVSLLGQVDHPSKSVEDVRTFSIGVALSDGVNPVASGVIEVSIEDDMPTAGDAEDGSVSLEEGSTDTGSLGISIGADRDGASVTLLIDGEEANGQQVVDINGNAVTSDGGLLYYFSDGTGGLYVATEGDGDSVLEITPTINSNGTTSYTVTVTGQLDANTESSPAGNVSVTLIESTTETVTLTGNFFTGTLKAGNYKPTETPVGGTITGTDATGEVIGTMDFYFKGFKDSDKITGEYVYGQAEDVSVSGQNVGVNSNHIDNTDDATANTNNDDGDGELLKLFFSKSVTGLSMLFDQLDSGETAYYSINQGATWISKLGTGTGGSSSSDEKIDINGADGFTELWIRGSEGSSFGILTDTIVAKWDEEVPTETSHTYNVSVIDVTGEDQTVTLSAQASDGDSDLSDLVSFDTTLDSAVDYDAVSVSGSTVSNFSVEQGDQLDLSSIFNDLHMEAADLASGGYLTVNVDSNTNTATISVDLDANGTAYSATPVVTLTNLDSGVTASQIINQIITEQP